MKVEWSIDPLEDNRSAEDLMEFYEPKIEALNQIQELVQPFVRHEDDTDIVLAVRKLLVEYYTLKSNQLAGSVD